MGSTFYYNKVYFFPIIGGLHYFTTIRSTFYYIIHDKLINHPKFGCFACGAKRFVRVVSRTLTVGRNSTTCSIKSGCCCYPSCLEQYIVHSVDNMKMYWNRCVLRQTNTYYLNLIESSHKLISKIQPVVTQVLRSPRENRTNKYSTYHDEEHAETKHHTHADIHSTTTPCSFLPVPRSTKNNH